MNGSYRRHGLARVMLGVLLAVVVGLVAYNLGFSHGLAQHVAAPPAGAYPWAPHPWGFGFFPVLFFLLFWFFVVRVLFWGVAGRRAWRYGRGCGPGYGYGYGGGGLPPMFDEWHRRAHERDREDRTVTSV
jgi:hypothetical protein